MEQEKTCETCRHYIQHYRKEKKRYYRIVNSHCVFPRLKNRCFFDKACQHYAPAEQDEQ